jgi:hypothetical protein
VGLLAAHALGHARHGQWRASGLRACDHPLRPQSAILLVCGALFIGAAIAITAHAWL